MRVARASRIAVPGGAITAYRMPALATPPVGSVQPLPVVFVPGWGGMIDGFRPTIGSINPAITLYYVETREKRSSDLDRRASFSLRRIASDIGAVVRRFGLHAGRFILVGSSFGGAVCSQALAQRSVEPAQTVLYDPMRRLWLPRWLIASVGRLLPAWLVTAMRPALKRLVVAGMTEQTQRRRTEQFIDDAELWKWRRAAFRMLEWDLHEVGPRINAQVTIVNGSSDRFHDSSIYPAIAASIPGARYVRVPLPETDREQLIGAIASIFAEHVSGASRGQVSLPELLGPFEGVVPARQLW